MINDTHAKMGRDEFLKALDDLLLSPREAADLLGYDHRTIKRWQEPGETVPSAPAEVLRAWRRLHRLGLPWRPGAAVIGLRDEDAIEQIRLYRDHARALDKVIEKVRSRGGPASPWKVDLGKNVAVLGGIEVHFYRLANDGFSLSTYTRKDKAPDYGRDRALIEDATACIAEAIAEQVVDRNEIPLLTAEEARKRGVQRAHKMLVANVTPVPGRPGWVNVEGYIWEPEGCEDSNFDSSPLRPQLGDMRKIYLEEVLRKKARERGAAYIVIEEDPRQ